MSENKISQIRTPYEGIIEQPSHQSYSRDCDCNKKNLRFWVEQAGKDSTNIIFTSEGSKDTTKYMFPNDLSIKDVRDYAIDQIEGANNSESDKVTTTKPTFLFITGGSLGAVVSYASLRMNVKEGKALGAVLIALSGLGHFLAEKHKFRFFSVKEEIYNKAQSAQHIANTLTR